MSQRNVHKKDFKKVSIPSQEERENRGFEPCKKPNIVLVDPSSEKMYKNHFTSIAFIADEITPTIELDGQEVAISGDALNFPHQENAVGYTVNWRDVYNQHGAGCYTLKATYDIGGLIVPFSYGEYEVMPYSVEASEGTILIVSQYDDKVKKTGINYRESGYVDCIRVEGTIGNEQPNSEHLSNLRTDDVRRKVRNWASPIIELEALPSEPCQIDKLNDLLMYGSMIWASDFNASNFKEYKDTPIVISNDSTIEYTGDFGYNRGLKVELEYKNWEIESKNAGGMGEGLPFTQILSLPVSPIECENATANIQQSDETLIKQLTIPSGGIENYKVADSVITVNTDAFASVKATDSLDVPVEDSESNTLDTTVVGGVVQVFLTWYMIAVLAFRQRMIDEGATFETDETLTTNIIELGETEYNNALLVLTPEGYDTGVKYAVKPNDGTADFDYIQNTTNGTRFNQNGEIEVLPANTPRISWVDGEPFIMVEESRTNFIEDSNMHNWFQSGSNYELLNTTLLGLNRAKRAENISGGELRPSSSGQGLIGNQVSLSVVAGQTVTYSFYYKPENTEGERVGVWLFGTSPNTVRCQYNITVTTGNIAIIQHTNITNQSITAIDIGSGVYRVVMTFEATEDVTFTANHLAVTNDTGAGIFAEPLVELGAVASSPILTNGAIATRNDDVYSINPPAGTTEIVEYLSDGTINTITTIPATYTPAVGLYKRIIFK